MIWLLSTLFITVILVTGVLFRNWQTYRFRQKLIDEEYAYLIDHPDISVRWVRYFSMASYDEMFVHFWKSLKSYEKPLSEYYAEAREIDR